MKTILLDIGSSTIKPYLFDGEKLKQLKQTSIHFKNNFINGNISHSDKNTLIKFIKSISTSNHNSLVKTYATSVFRDLSESNKDKLIEEVFSKTGVLFNIIDSTTESLYLQLAVAGKYNVRKNLMLVNIGGGSTELIIIKSSRPIERKNIKIGVGTILTKYPKINDEISGVTLTEITNFVKKELPALDNGVNTAFYTGGELHYMQITKYSLKTNTLFADKSHPSIITYKDFSNKNCEIFYKTTLKKLEGLTPDNPKWMHGARACSALAQAIFQQYYIEIIVPSNSNLIDGVVRYEFGI